MALDIGIQLLQQVAAMFGTKAAKVLVFQEEVYAQIRFADHSRVLYGELADTGQDKVFQRLDADNAGPIVDDEDVRLLKRKLAGSSPQPQLSVVPALVNSCFRPWKSWQHSLLLFCSRALNGRR